MLLASANDICTTHLKGRVRGGGPCLVLLPFYPRNGSARNKGSLTGQWAPEGKRNQGNYQGQDPGFSVRSAGSLLSSNYQGNSVKKPLSTVYLSPLCWVLRGQSSAFIQRE